MSSPTVSIIVISYNTKQMTLECLASVYEQTKVPFEIIVVDNASPDGSAEAIAEAFPDVKLIAETTNHGFAPAHVVAMPHATAPWVLLLNPDTLVLNSAIDEVLSFAERTPDAGIWGGRTVYGDHSPNPYSCWRAMTLWNVFCRTTGLTGIFRNSPLFNNEEYAGWDRSTEREVDIVTGCFFLIKRDMWDRLGGFDPDFTMYGEEADLCLRAQKLGARPRITPDATIVHYGGASESVAADRRIRIYRSKAELVQRHFPAWQKPIAQKLFMVFPWTRWMANAALGRVLKRDSMLEKAQMWAEIWARRSEWSYGFPK